MRNERGVVFMVIPLVMLLGAMTGTALGYWISQSNYFTHLIR